MTAIVENVLSKAPIIESAMTSYIDDLFVDESIVSVDDAVKNTSHLLKWGLEGKKPERLGSTEVLGLRVDKDLI